MSKSKQAVVVTTKHRGVFFGYADYPAKGDKIVLEKARMCIYWSADVKGVLGLAATGPSKSCRVGPPVPEITINAVTAIAKASPESISAWESGPWN